MKLILLFSMLFISNFVFSQVETNTSNDSLNVSQQTEECDGVSFLVVENPPKYIGGLTQLGEDLSNLTSFKKNVSYKTYINFKVDCKGSLSRFICQGNGNEEINNKLIETLKKLPNWEAGKQGGESVNCSRTVGITIKKGKISVEYYEIK